MKQIMKDVTFDKNLEEILKSLYETGCNDGKNNIVYLPKPVGFKLSQIKSLIGKLLERKSVSELEPIMDDVFKMDGAIKVSFKEGYNTCIRELRKKFNL